MRLTKNRENVIVCFAFSKKGGIYMSLEEMSQEELIEYKNTLFWEKNKIMYQLQSKIKEEGFTLNELQDNYRNAILNTIEELQNRIEIYYSNKVIFTSFKFKKIKIERLQFLMKVTSMYALYNYLFANDMDKYLFDLKNYTFQDQEETIEKRNYDLELYDALESKIPGVMDAYFDAKVAYCKALPELRKRKKELEKNPITAEDEIHMKQKLNLIEMQVSSIERVLKKKEMELQL